MESVSPRQAAKALGVSESSLKRWCDQGRIAFAKTAGGHRRLAVSDLAEFVRSANLPAVRLELLGLPARLGTELAPPVAADRFYDALMVADEAACRRLVLDLYLADQRISQICDRVIAAAMRRAGADWECGDIDVYQERRGCEICLRLLAELRLLIPPRKESAPKAIGAAPECDAYTIPSAMVELCLRQSGWRAETLGSRLPWKSMQTAIADLKPQLFWLSVSHVDDEAKFLREYLDFYAQLQPDVAIVVGGRALTESLRSEMEFSAYCGNLQHLDGFARTLRRTLERPARRSRKEPL